MFCCVPARPAGRAEPLGAARQARRSGRRRGRRALRWGAQPRAARTTAPPAGGHGGQAVRSAEGRRDSPSPTPRALASAPARGAGSLQAAGFRVPGGSGKRRRCRQAPPPPFWECARPRRGRGGRRGGAGACVWSCAWTAFSCGERGARR